MMNINHRHISTNHSRKSTLLIVSLVVALLIVTVLSFESYSSYKSELKNAERQSRNLSQVLEEQISTSYHKIDIALQAIQDQYQNESSIDTRRSEHFSKLLLLYKKRLPEVLGFKAVDAKGNFIADDLGFLNPYGARDRESYIYLKNNPKNELFISKPLFGRIAQTWVLQIARPLLSKDGKFRGLVFGTIPLEHYHKIFSELNIGKNGAITLLNTNEILYARMPSAQPFYGKKTPLPKEMIDFLHGPQSLMVYQNVSSLDNIDRLLTARKFFNFPLVVVVGFSKKDLLFSWKVRTGIYAVLIIIIFFVFGFFLFNFIKSLEKIEEQRKMAIQSAKLSSLGEMASGIAHEINNPLAIIAAVALLLKRTNVRQENPEKYNDSLDTITSTVDRIAKIIKGLLLFSRDSFNDPSVPYSLKKIFDNTLGLCQERLKSKDIVLNILPFEDFKIDCREVQIVQVLINLLNNSVDAVEEMPDKWIQIEV
ncbi:MAG: sensor histidine kinase, partial [Alphaproteobacteria bacterium]